MVCVDCGHRSKYTECKLCHRIRNGIDRDVFYKICARINEAYPTQRKRKISTKRVVGHPFCKGDCISKHNSYEELVRQSQRLKVRRHLKEPLLTKSEFEKIISKPCIFCGVYGENGAGGIDRIQSSIGYVRGNCLSSCSQCNYMKKNINLHVFIDKIRDIDEHQAQEYEFR